MTRTLLVQAAVRVLCGQGAQPQRARFAGLLGVSSGFAGRLIEGEAQLTDAQATKLAMALRDHAMRLNAVASLVDDAVVHIPVVSRRGKHARGADGQFIRTGAAA